MAAQVELRLSVPVDQARQLIGTALAEQGFTAQVTPTGSLDVSRGSLGTTLVAGALAGQDMHVRFDVDFVDAGAGSIANIRSSSAGAFFKGGAIGASKANDAVREAAHQLGVRLAAQGVLQGSTATETEPVGVGAVPVAAGAVGSTPPPPAAFGAPPAYGSGIPAPIDYANRTNVVAIVAIILGFVFPIGGIIAGAVALAQVKRTGEKGRGLAIAGISVGSALTLLYIVGAIALFSIGFAASQNVESQDETPIPIPSPVSPLEDEPAPTEEPESVDVFSIAIGDCLNDAGTDEVSNVGLIDCAQPHDYEVYTELELPGDAFPGTDEVDSLASDGCYEAFPSFVGLAYEDSVLDYTYYVPTQESWDTRGDRLVSCLIYEPDVQSAGSLAGVAR